MDLENRFNLNSDEIQEEKLYLTDVIPDEYYDFIMKYAKERAEGFKDIQILSFDSNKKHYCLLLCSDNSPDLYFRSKGIACEEVRRIYTTSDHMRFVRDYTIITKNIRALFCIASEIIIPLMESQNVEKIIDILEHESARIELELNGGIYI